jgi:hypothetical protein
VGEVERIVRGGLEKITEVVIEMMIEEVVEILKKIQNETNFGEEFEASFESETEVVIGTEGYLIFQFVVLFLLLIDVYEEANSFSKCWKWTMLVLMLRKKTLTELLH